MATNPVMTRDLAWSAAQDAANAQMRAAGRSKWSADDYQLAVGTFDRLWPEERDYNGNDTALAPFPHAGGCEPCAALGICNYCGGPRTSLNGCTNGRCNYCHRTVCASGGDTSPGHGFGKSGGPHFAKAAPSVPAPSAPVPVCRTVLCFEGEEIELKPASEIVLCRCGHPRNRHAAYSSGTSCADCDCKAYDGAPVLPEDFASPRQRLPYQYVHHVDGDHTNNDLGNLEVRTGYAGVDPDPERKGQES